MSYRQATPLRSSTPAPWDFEDTLRRGERLLGSNRLFTSPSAERTMHNLTLSIQALSSKVESQEDKSIGHMKSLKFSGTENPISFLDKFEIYAAHCKKSHRQKLTMLPCYFEGVALTWYKELPEDTKQDFSDLKEAFLLRFNNPSLKWVKQQKIMDREQRKNESVDDYLNDMHILCSNLEKNPEERMNLFLKGLIQPIRNFVIGKEPKSVSDVESWARLGDQLGLGQTDTVAEMLLQETVNLRAEINELNTQRQSTFQPWGRAARTTDGQIVCSNCKSVGHHRQSCHLIRSNNNSRRCYYCGSPHHFINNCEKRKADERQFGRSPRRGGNQPPRFNRRDNSYHQRNTGNEYRPTSGGR